nr:tetratricopeptide repeat-containing protein [Aquidulcibacter paucihalophilus]
MVTGLKSYILRLARSGSLDRAWSLMEQHGLLDSTIDSRALTLQARLVKDRAKRLAEDERVHLFSLSADLYCKAAALERSSYPLINAASLRLLANQRSGSADLAQEVLNLLDADPNEGETPYWREATRAEALLLLGREAEARAALKLAVTTHPEAWEDQAATIGQFGLIQSHLKQDISWLDDFRPPPSVHFSGIVGMAFDGGNVKESIRQFLASERPGFVYGALAAGADLLFAHEFLEYRNSASPFAEMHVVLPLPVDQFRETSVRAYGENWVPLFESALDQATSVTIVGTDVSPLKLAIEHADQVAMGCTVRNAQVFQSQAIGLTIVAPAEGLRPQLAAWQQSDRRLEIINGSRDRKILSQNEDLYSRQKLMALVWFSNASLTKVSPYIDPDLTLVSEESGCWLACDQVVKAGDLAIQLAGIDKAARISMLYAIFDPIDPPKMLRDRAKVLANASMPGTVATDSSSAFVLTLQRWSGAINELGEIGTQWGVEPVWSLSKF